MQLHSRPIYYYLHQNYINIFIIYICLKQNNIKQNHKITRMSSSYSTYL